CAKNSDDGYYGGYFDVW
nr:immunoglobulin heavy chain junction region [Mus musculus]